FLIEESEPVADVLDYSIKNLLHNFDLNYKHALNVYDITASILSQLESEFSFDFCKFSARIDKIVKTAALLHDAGTNINYYDHHEHSFYIILNADLYGLTHRELLLSAYIAASHRHSKYSLHKYNLNRKSFKDIITRKGSDKELIRKIGIILEIAESLDLNRKDLIERIEIEKRPKEIIFNIISDYDLRLEIEDATETRSGFKSLFNKELSFRLLDSK
ncbi:MAG: hypothetical protein ACOCZY_01455, partial [Bacillota bacterium]